MLYKAWQTYKNEYSSPLLKLLIQDSVLYFASIFVVLATNCLVFFVGPPGLVQIAQGWEFAIPCAMGSRLLLSMFDHTGRQHTFGGQSQQPLGAGYMLSDMRKPDLSARHVEPPVDFLPAIDMGDDTNMGSDTIGTAELMIRLGDSPTLNIL
ncbi:hypothetical protein JB92DRAFT_358347 [Gautieria morchelliformis]|nr:hypothetical protein JB92DRAFT_358347 [Gautieria morchelliformis]